MAAIAPRLIRRAGSVGAVLVAAAILAPAAAAWQPEAARYGVATQSNLPVRMSDGTVLRANVYSPADPVTGKPATGPFPVILTQTPYGKDDGKYGGGTLAELSGESAYLVPARRTAQPRSDRGPPRDRGADRASGPAADRDPGRGAAAAERPVVN
jgi:hypothetical protein